MLRVASAGDPVERDWPARAWEHARAATSELLGDLQAGGRESVRRRRAGIRRNRSSSQLGAAAGTARRQRARAAVARDGRRGLRPAGRLRERGEPAARARVDATARAGPADGVRGAQGPGRAARADRELLLALLGSAVGLLFAYSTSGVARTLLADRIPHIDTIAIDWRVLAFNMAVAVATGMLCGLVSLPGVRRVSLTAIFSSGAPAVTGRSRIRRVLLSAEMAVTFVLVVGAALLVQTLWNLSAQDRGFDADRLLTVRVSPGLPRDLDRTRSPGGLDVLCRCSSATCGTAWSGYQAWPRPAPCRSRRSTESAPASANIAVDGRRYPTASRLTPVAFVTPGYFRTMRIPVIGGRDFDESDRLGAERVAIVNEAFQRRFAPEWRHPRRAHHVGVGSRGLYHRRRDAGRPGPLASPGAGAAAHGAARADAWRAYLLGRADIRPANRRWRSASPRARGAANDLGHQSQHRDQ